MTARKAPSGIPTAKLALYEKLVATDPSLERKGATVPYTSVSGKMFSYLDPMGELRLRLPPDDRASFQKKYRTATPLSGGVLMKDWVAVPAALLARTAELRPYFVKSRAYAESVGARSNAKRGAGHAAPRRKR